VAERLNAPRLKRGEPSGLRGFESHPPRHRGDSCLAVKFLPHAADTRGDPLHRAAHAQRPLQSGIPFTATTRVADRGQLLATIVSTVWDSVLRLVALLRTGAEDLDGHPSGPTMTASLLIVGGWSGAVPPSQVSLPSVVEGTTYTYRAPRTEVLNELTFACLGKRIRVTVLEQVTHAARESFSPTLPG
jgi:hypothetical protein